MKKIYSQPEWTLVNFEEEDVITTSTTVTYDKDGLFDKGDKVDSWTW